MRPRCRNLIAGILFYFGPQGRGSIRRLREEMQFRRSGQRDERRRKVLLDDTSPEAESTPTPTNKTGKSDAIAKAYAKAAVEETETRVADLIPTRPLGVSILLLLGLTAIAAVQALYTFVPDWSGPLGPEGVAAFDLANSGSLNSWLSALLFAAGAAMSGLIYVIRRHKMDDYRGRYRMWLWASAAMMLASVNAVAGLHHAFDALVLHLSGRTLLTGVTGWAMLTISLIGGILGLRLLMDMWRSRGSSAALVSAAVSYGIGTWLIIFQPLPAGSMLATMMVTLAFSIGHLLLAFSTVVYARRVLLEARGLLKVKKKQAKAKPKTKAKAKKESQEPAQEKSTQRQEKNASGRKLKVDPPHRQASQPAKADKKQQAKEADNKHSDSAVSSTPTEADELGPAEGSPEWNKLSKAQRRRVKKLRRRKAAAAAA